MPGPQSFLCPVASRCTFGQEATTPNPCRRYIIQCKKISASLLLSTYKKLEGNQEPVTDDDRTVQIHHKTQKVNNKNIP